MTTETQQPSLAETYAGEALGIAWPAGTWPGEIGQRLILQQNVRRDWYHKPVADYQTIPQAPRHRGHGQSIGWRRLPTEAEAQYPGAHAFDRSGDYLAAAGAAVLPVGTPVWEANAPIIESGELVSVRRAGFWHVRVDYMASRWNGYELPAVCPQGDVWLWTPSLRAALTCGYAIEGHGAILWPDHHPILRTWAERVWAARRALEENFGSVDHDYWAIDSARREAVQLVKQVYVVTIGHFGHELSEFPGTTDQERAADAGRLPDLLQAWQRPEWFCTIHAEALAYSFAVMRRAVERGYPPLWARLDTLGFACHAAVPPNYLAEEAGLFMKPGALGAWRYDYSLPMSELLVTRGHDVEIPSRAERARLPAVRVRR